MVDSLYKKIGETKNPMLKILHIIDYNALSNCGKKISSALENATCKGRNMYDRLDGLTYAMESSSIMGTCLSLETREASNSTFSFL
jgi:hypothetical protein